MSYTISLTNGSLLTTVADGTIDTTTNLNLVGRNYAGYGSSLNENFIKLLENASSSIAPSNPLVGQLWWDSVNKHLNVWQGTNWKVISSSASGTTSPANPVTGDFWWNPGASQFSVYNGSQWIVVGPTVIPGITTGILSAAVTDGITVHSVGNVIVNNKLSAIFSSENSPFNPVGGLGGLTTINPGLNLVAGTSVTSPALQSTTLNVSSGATVNSFVSNTSITTSTLNASSSINASTLNASSSATVNSFVSNTSINTSTLNASSSATVNSFVSNTSVTAATLNVVTGATVNTLTSNVNVISPAGNINTLLSNTLTMFNSLTLTSGTPLYIMSTGYSTYRISNNNGSVYFNNGTDRMWLDSNGNLTAYANITAFSDERLKTNWRLVMENFVSKLAKVKSGIYDRIDGNLTQAGISAQDFQKILPETVLVGEDGMLSVAYGHAAMVSAVELAKEIVDLKQQVAELTQLVNRLVDKVQK